MCATKINSVLSFLDKRRVDVVLKVRIVRGGACVNRLTVALLLCLLPNVPTNVKSSAVSVIILTSSCFMFFCECALLLHLMEMA